MDASRARWTVSLAAGSALFIAGCGGDDDDSANSASASDGGSSTLQTPEPSPTTAQIAATEFASCYAGEGTSDGTKLYATLRLTRGVGEAISGTYVVGESKTGGMSYAISGTLKDNKLDSVWTAAGQGLNVTGTVTAAKVELENPSGEFSITEFEAGCD